jgi:hypothetical protein
MKKVGVFLGVIALLSLAGAAGSFAQDFTTGHFAKSF